ncbi:hypothetical protein Sango_3044500 [Sesamum angolense]|uniref:Uncharacterized protein n=1 Tax=Sesamum angolense TaxID=2727404 RepID=A0AAE1TAL3_9LAMI|nr:hypothetical protein Sango_3044500 [Sesamum angolense]
MFGHAEFVREYIRLSSISAHQLSQLNQDGYSPLHLASANSHLEIVQILLEVGKHKSALEELCLKKDRDGRTALHSVMVTAIEPVFATPLSTTLRYRLNLVSDVDWAACVDSHRSLTRGSYMSCVSSTKFQVGFGVFAPTPTWREDDKLPTTEPLDSTNLGDDGAGFTNENGTTTLALV